jgi:hypothetical protein
VIRGTVEAMKWPLDCEGSINTGARGLASRTNMGLESECRASSRDMNARLTDIAWTTASKILDQVTVAVPAESEADLEQSASTGIEKLTEGAAGYSCSRRQSRFEVLTRPAEIQNVIMVAEKLPAPAEIDLAWVRRHDWIVAKVLLDESFRDALDTIGQGAPTSTQQPLERLDRDIELDATRERLYEHLRANILHYQQAIWRQEDPQQRSMRYRKSGKKVPLEWRFELESGGALTIEELGDRLASMNVDGQFAAYSAGREADLDQVIDPAGPIGYHGNYAIYHMRPEFGSDELFSMLHFFKSPYLRPHPETGQPEVVDPEQIHPSEDPALVAASDQLFRRERTRRFAVDTGGLVIDVIRNAEPVPEKSAHDDVAHLSEPLQGSELILESGCEVELLRTNGKGDADAEWTLVRNGEAHMATLLAGHGNGGALKADPENDPAIRPRLDGAQIRRLCASPPPDPAAERLIVAGDDDGPRLTLATHGGAVQAHEQPLLSGVDEQASALRIAQASDPEAERLIVSEDDAALKLTAVAADVAPHTNEQAVFAQREEERTPGLLAGAFHALERLILSGEHEDPTPILRAGGAGARDPEAEPAIFAREDGERLRLGGEAAQNHESAIVAGGDGERKQSLVAGSGLSHSQGSVILSGEGEALNLTMFIGSAAAQAHERPILAEGDGERRPKLLAGAGTRRSRERVILAREAEWLRPSLVAG